MSGSLRDDTEEFCGADMAGEVLLGPVEGVWG